MIDQFNAVHVAMIVSAGAVLVAVVYWLEMLWTARRQRLALEAADAVLAQPDNED
jgi:hypothetical protein